MAFEIKTGRKLGKQVRKLARQHLNKALRALQDAKRDDNTAHQDAAVHDVRRRIKEVRALLRLVCGGLGKKFKDANHTLRKAARPLSKVRDATALMDALHATRDSHRAGRKDIFTSAEKLLRRRRINIRRQVMDEEHALRKAATAVKKVRREIAGWHLGRGSWKVIQPGLRDTYRNLRQATRQARSNAKDENFHEWRKRAKDFRYQMRLLRAIHPQ